MSSASTDQNGRVCFSDVARAHWRWDRAGSSGPSAEQKADYDKTLAAFEKTVDTRQDAEVRVLESYWCRKQASGVVLVEVRSSKALGPLQSAAKSLRLWHPIPEYRVFRESDWVTVEFPKLANLLHECDVLAIKARWGLEGLHQAVVMPWLMAVEQHILGFIERDWRRRRRTEEPHERAEARDESKAQIDEQEITAFYNEVLRELNRIEDYYQQAGVKRARLHFVSAMLTFGLLIVLLAALAVAGALQPFGLLHLHDAAIRRLYAAMAAGAVGAIVSVLMRMSGARGDFKIDHELGSAGVRRLGALRPLVGAVCGVIVALLVQTTLVASQNSSVKTPFFVVIAFLAGFSERWTKVMLAGAMRTVERPEDSSETSAEGAGQPAPAAPPSPAH